MLGVIWGASLSGKGRSLLSLYRKFILASSAVLLFLCGSYLSFVQYQVTSSDPVGMFFLPPYHSIAYFLFFIVVVRIFGPYIISAIIAALFLWVATRYNRKYEGRFFEKEEIQLGALAIFLSGHPGWIFYFVALISLYVLIHLYNLLIRHKNGERIPLYHLWVPTAIFVILISEYLLSGTVFWHLLQI